MNAARALERIVRASARRPARVVAAAAALAAVCAALALTLDPSAATDTLVNRSSDSYAATERYRERFGEQSVIVLVRGEVSNLVLTKNLNALVGLEGCLSGNKPADAPAPGGERSPCAALARTKPVQVVYGPGTFVNSAVGEIQDQLQLRSQATAAQAAAGRARGAQGRARPGALEGRAGQGREGRRAGRLRRAAQGAAADQPALRARPDRRAPAQRPELRLRARLRPQPRRGHAEGALRVPVPEPHLVGDPGAPEGVAQRRAAPRRDRADPGGGGDAAVEARQGHLHRHGRARGARGPRGRARRLGAAAARGGAGRDGARARRSCSAAACGSCRCSSRWPPWRSRSGRWRWSARR